VHVRIADLGEFQADAVIGKRLLVKEQEAKGSLADSCCSNGTRGEN